MHPASRITTALAAAAITALAVVPTMGVSAPAAPTREVARLRTHFDSVDTELRMRSVRGLTALQRRHRTTLIGWLREYRDAGVFPHNDRFPGTPMPYFRDARRVLCAMAYLIDRSGRGDLVDRVARTANNAFIPDLAGDPELGAWLDSTGLTLTEAARIQPTYGGGGGVIVTSDLSGEYVALSFVASGASLVAGGFNLARPTATSGILGLTAGALAFFLGSQRDGLGREDRSLATINRAIGVGSVALGVYGLLSSRSERGAIRTASAPASVAEIRIGPTLVPTSGTTRFGVAVQARF